jgi:hypothetical protein
MEEKKVREIAVKKQTETERKHNKRPNNYKLKRKF